MADTIDLLKTRKSVPAAFLSGPGPNDAEIETLLTIASRVPDHGKLVPWRFIVLRGDARLDAAARLGKLYEKTNPGQGEAKIAHVMVRAPLAIAVVSRAGPHEKIPEIEQLLSAGASAMNIVVASHALGYAANWITGWAAYNDEARAILGLKPEERLAAIVFIGTSTLADAPERPRPALADIVTEWRPPSD